jgi:hypothetical protein
VKRYPHYGLKANIINMIPPSLYHAIAALGSAANANIIYLNQIVDVNGQGFGNAPRLLTIQAQGNNTTESGVIGILNGAIATVPQVSGATSAQVFMGNNVTNVGGDEVNPLAGNKFNIPTLSSLNWTNASNVVLLFNATEPGGNSLNITDVTLKFYSGNTLIAAIDGSQAFANTPAIGNGNAGFLFGVDAQQQAFLNTNVFSQPGSGNFRIALESTITGVHGGPESFSAVVASAVPEPATWGMMLLGFVGLGFAFRRSRPVVSFA